NHRAVLDCGAGIRAVFADHIEIEVRQVRPGMDLAGKRVLVVGLARTGMATALFATARGAAVTATEERPEAELAGDARKLREAGVALEFGGHTSVRFLEQDLIVVSPGVPAKLAPLELARA